MINPRNTEQRAQPIWAGIRVILNKKKNIQYTGINSQKNPKTLCPAFCEKANNLCDKGRIM